MDKILLERARIAVRDVVSKYEDKTHYAKFIQERMVDTYGWYGWNVVVDPKGMEFYPTNWVHLRVEYVFSKLDIWIYNSQCVGKALLAI